MQKPNVNPVSSTEKFSPSRLAVARRRRSFSKRELAKAVGITGDAVTKFENGSCAPSSQTAAHLALVLRFPQEWFFKRDIPLVPDEAVSFRSRRSMTAATRDKALAVAEMTCWALSPAIHRRFNLPPMQVPDLSQHSPKDAAKLLREEWKLGQGPISSMIHLLEAKGVEVYWLNEPVRTMDAWSFVRDNRAYITFNTHIMDGAREQFDAAHELGHLVLHQAYSPLTEKVGERDIEKEAHQFASCFLMPEETFRSTCPRLPLLDQFLNLKRYWCASVGSMIYRAKELEVLSEWHYQIAARDLASRGWRTGEPEVLPRQVSNAHKVICEVLKQQNISPLVLAHESGVSAADLYEFMPVTTQYVAAWEKKNNVQSSGKLHSLFATKQVAENRTEQPDEVQVPKLALVN